MSSPYEAVIGLEIHVQLLTASKAFCGCPARSGDAPNANVCPVCLGLPGALPVVNRALVESAVRLGLALGAEIAPASRFARKHYSYPDLPKGYQITQHEHPICAGGSVEIERADGSRRRVGITRVHMEEDAGKSLHADVRGTLVDLNRAGIPLLEIVTEPEVGTAKDASLTLQQIRQIVTYLGICDGSMEEGSLRCDANVSIRASGGAPLGPRTELKNMNSFRNLERAIDFELARQLRLAGEGVGVEPETLLWDADRTEARPMRGKEGEREYRHLPDPDLAPVAAEARWVEELARTLPELPVARRDRFLASYGLSRADAGVLTAERGTADYFEAVLGALGGGRTTYAKSAANWVMTEVLRCAAERGIPVALVPVPPARLADLLRLVADRTVSVTMAKEVFARMAATGESPAAVIAGRGLSQLSDEGAIIALVDEVLARNPEAAEQCRAGKAALFGFFVGEVMRLSGGRANPQTVNLLLKRKL